MASLEHFQQAVAAWERLDRLCDKASVHPHFKENEGGTFLELAVSLRGCLDKIEPNFWEADPDVLDNLIGSLSKLGDSVLKLFGILEEEAKPPCQS